MAEFRQWFGRKFGEPTPPQARAWPEIVAGKHVLIASPTGTGKTLAAFFPILETLEREALEGRLREGIHAIYVSPLRALGYDLEKNLDGPIREVFGSDPPIRVGLRSGDTDPSERIRQKAKPPHVLLTTPESLCLLLSQESWRSALASVRWIVVDEIHSIAGNKRGSHLSLTLERLDHLVRPGKIQRIGLSATVAPLALVGEFLAGAGRPCLVIDVSGVKAMDLKVYTPLQRDPYPPAGYSGARLLDELSKLIPRNRTTLIFTNTRSGAESTSYWLRQSLPDLANQIECHHASLDREVRLEVEDRLKRGELRAVVCSTSLELGIDIGSIDLVVMLATPKGVSRALQRTGRAGHSIRETSRGLLMATNVNDLVECCATARLARAGHLDHVRIPENPLDVLAQHLMGMGCLREWTKTEAHALVRQAWPFRTLSVEDFEATLEYLAGGGRSLRMQYQDLFGKIHLSEATFEARGGAARRDFLQNIGTIPSEGVIRVIHGGRSLGTLEEGFVRQLKPGDVFSLAGYPVRLERLGNMEAYVVPAPGKVPTISRWNANKFPLANRVAREIREFRSELRDKFQRKTAVSDVLKWIALRLECGANNAAVIYRIHAAQHAMSRIPTSDVLLVEDWMENVPPDAPPVPEKPRRKTRRKVDPTEDSGGADQLAMAPLLFPGRARQRWNDAESRRSRVLHQSPPTTETSLAAPLRQRLYFFHSLIGRSANDALARVVGLRLSRLHGGNSVATADDYGFVLTVPETIELLETDFRVLLDAGRFLEDLRTSLSNSDLMKYHFRNAAQTGLMVYRNYFGESKSVRKLQWSAEVIFHVLAQHEPQHVLMREARRDAEHTFLDAPRAVAFLEDLKQREVPVARVSPARIPPLSFGMYATRIKEALRVENPEETLERLYHQWWKDAGIPGDVPPAE